MRIRRGVGLGLGFMGLGLGCGWMGLAARAGTIQLTSASQLSSGDATLTYPGPPNTGGATGIYTAGGNTLSFIGFEFAIYQVGTNYSPSGFANGTNILEELGASSPIDHTGFTFSSPVTQVGLNLEEDITGNETFLVTVLGLGGMDIGDYSVTGNDPTALAFFGAQATGTDQITGLEISDPADTDIGLGPVTFGSPSVAATPEPGTFGLLGLGLAAVAMLRRRWA